MTPSLPLKAALAGLLIATSSGCATTAQRAQAEAGERLGVVTAGVTIAPQPAECGQAFPALPIAPGDEALAVIKQYDAYITGPVNGRIARCYRFNEDQRAGLVDRKMP